MGHEGLIPYFHVYHPSGRTACGQNCSRQFCEPSSRFKYVSMKILNNKSIKIFWKVVGREGFEPSTNWLKANCSTNWANDPYRILVKRKVVGREGFEPSTNWLKANCSTNWANDPYLYQFNALRLVPQRAAYDTYNFFSATTNCSFFYLRVYLHKKPA